MPTISLGDRGGIESADRTPTGVNCYLANVEAGRSDWHSGLQIQRTRLPSVANSSEPPPKKNSKILLPSWTWNHPADKKKLHSMKIFLPDPCTPHWI